MRGHRPRDEKVRRRDAQYDAARDVDVIAGRNKVADDVKELGMVSRGKM